MPLHQGMVIKEPEKLEMRPEWNPRAFVRSHFVRRIEPLQQMKICERHLVCHIIKLVYEKNAKPDIKRAPLLQVLRNQQTAEIPAYRQSCA